MAGSASRLPPPQLTSIAPAKVAAMQQQPDFEARLRKLAAEVRSLKERFGAAAEQQQQQQQGQEKMPTGGLKSLMAQGGQGGGMRPGDHAMLSSKPLLGLRCMACDRPLVAVDELPGPFVPSGG
jgi:hypothetical protein